MIEFISSSLGYIVPFLFVLGLVVTVHEYGHFLAARLCGVEIERFSIGFGKAIASWRDKQGVEWRLGWLPLGGYVKFAGDDNAASVPDSDDLEALRRQIEAREGGGATARYFHFKPLWQRAIVVAAGPFANFVLASALFALLLGVFGEVVTPPRIGEVLPGGAAERAGFQAGDVVVKAGGQSVRDFGDLYRTVSLRPGRTTEFVVLRDGRERTLTAAPEAVSQEDRISGHVTVGRLGVKSVQPEAVRYNPVEAVGAGVRRTGQVLTMTVSVLGQMLTGQVSPNNISGVLGIAKASGAVAQDGAQGAPDAGSAVLGSLVALLGLAAVMSVSIGFMNLLPVPVLDGGHLLFYAYEALARRPVGAKVQAAGYRVGLALLLGLMVFATFNDLQRLRVFQILGGLFS